jgi:hypothetical protein
MATMFVAMEKFSKIALNSYFVRREIEGPIPKQDISCTIKFSILINNMHLIEQASIFADTILKAQIDPRKIFNSFSQGEDYKLILMKVYIYSFYKGYFMGLNYQTVNLDTNSNLLLRGHCELFSLLKARNFSIRSSNFGECLKKLEVIDLHQKQNIISFEKFSKWLDPIKYMGNIIYFEIDRFEAILFSLKNLAKTQKESIGLDYWIDDINSPKTSVTDPVVSYLGNMSYSQSEVATIKILYSEDLNIKDGYNIINPALFVTLIDESYTFQGNMKHSVYRDIDYSKSQHLRRFEVEAITGMKCNSIPNISGELINNLISPIKPSPNKSSGGSSANKP